MQSIVLTRPSLTCLRRNLHDGATCTTRRCTSASLHARLGNPSQTCFHTKQAARSQRVNRADLPPLILWRNRQIKACLVLKPKLRNRRGDFDAQITKSELPVLRSKPGNPPPPWFWVSTKKPTAGFKAKPRETATTSFEAKLEKTVAAGFVVKPLETVTTGFHAKPLETIAAGFEAKPPETIATDFEVKPTKIVWVVLKPNHSQIIVIGFEAQTYEKSSEWFLGQTTHKPLLSVWRPKPMRNHPNGFEAKPLTNRRSWF
jgi:hypothetical protein